MDSRKIFRVALGALFSTVLAACALPVPEGGEGGGFVPEKEMVSVEIIREGMGYYDRNRFIDAEGNFRQALYLNPGLVNIRTNLAATLDKTGQFEEAEQLYLGLMKESREQVNILSGYARLMLSQRNFPAALEYFQKAYAVAVLKGDLASQLAIERSIATISSATGHTDEALCYSGAMYSVTRSKKDLIQFTKILLFAGKFEAASRILEAAASELDLGNDPEILHQRAISAYALGNFAESLEFERRGLFSADLSPEIKPELMIVKFAAENKLGMVPDEADREDVLEKTSEMAETIFKSGGDPLLYWPPNLLEDARQMIKTED